MKQKLLLFAILLTTLPVFATSAPPKREFRAVWVATVANLDWPTRGAATQTQKQELINLFDLLKSAGINAILFQIRPECDALYASPYEPWSYWLTGVQGKAPSPFYDPLEFAVEEAHKRGMELHAWFNPYRAVRAVGSYSTASNHVSITHPEWILYFSKIQLKMLDPGRPDVREYVTQVVKDVVQRYDIDGVHFDDYFYPYPDGSKGFFGITNEDDQTFANFNRGFSDRADWRRDNVNLLVKMVHDAIAITKPWVKFGISPFGIWKSGNPPGISGTSAYDAIYCDALAWLNARTVDYLTPQLYWPIGGGQDYSKLMPWWASKINGLHFYPGHAAYRISDWSHREMPNQLRLDRGNAACGGSVFFRAASIRSNLKGFTDSLKNDFYRFKAITPLMAWKNDIAPLPPRFLQYGRSISGKELQLQWSAPTPAADGDTAKWYVVYRHQFSSPSLDHLNDPGLILEITRQRQFTLTVPNGSGQYFYTVTAVDPYGLESSADATIAIDRPSPPLLATPLQDESGVATTVPLRWHTQANAMVYELQVANNNDFSAPLIVHQIGLSDTFYTIKNLKNQTRYYWRVRGANPGGWGEFSETRSFMPGLPTAPLLAFPADDRSAVPISTPLAWHPVASNVQYHLQVSLDYDFTTEGIVIDQTGLADTFMVVDNLNMNQIYYWRVRAANQLGYGNWSSVYRFSTTTITLAAELPTMPLKLDLGQNYPNPFNNQTIIPFTLPSDGLVRLYIYDMLGRKVMTLAHSNFTAGRHEIAFDASSLAGGVYVYRLFYQGHILSRRMLYVK